MLNIDFNRMITGIEINRSNGKKSKCPINKKGRDYKVKTGLNNF